MIKAMMQSRDGAPIVLLGLTTEDVERLTADEPMVVDLADLGLPTQLICIIAGTTENEMTALVRGVDVEIKEA